MNYEPFIFIGLACVYGLYLLRIARTIDENVERAIRSHYMKLGESIGAIHRPSLSERIQFGISIRSLYLLYMHIIPGYQPKIVALRRVHITDGSGNERLELIEINLRGTQVQSARVFKSYNL